MKKRTFVESLFILIVVFPWFSAHADFINVISQDYSIEASARFYFDPTYNKYYQETSNIPILLHENINVLGDDWHGAAILDASASGDVGALSAMVHCFAHSYDEGDVMAYASSLASITFAPLVEKMILTTEIGSAVSIYLFDLTSHQTLYSLYGLDGMQSESSILDFDLSHIYSINIETDMINYWHTEGILSIAPVHEPATMLLLGLGLMGLAGVRRKLKKSRNK